MLGFIARRGLMASPGTFVLLVAAIAIATGFQIGNSATLAGFERAVLEGGLDHGPGDLRVVPSDRLRFEPVAPIEAAIRDIAGVGSAAGVLSYPAAARPAGRERRREPTAVIGVPSDERPYVVVRGNGVPSREGGALIGEVVADRLGIAIGDRVELAIMFGVPGELMPSEDDDSRVARVTVTAVGVVGGAGGSYRAIFVDREWLGSMTGSPSGANSVVVRTADHYAAGQLRDAIAAAVPTSRVTTWQDDQPMLENFLSLATTLRAVSYAIVVAAVAIPMWALLYIQVLRRRRELAILVALGFSRREVFAIVVGQSAIAAVVGCGCGLGLGALLIGYFTSSPLFEWQGMVVHPLATTASFVIPIAALIATALAASCYPAWQATRTDPARLLRAIG